MNSDALFDDMNSDALFDDMNSDALFDDDEWMPYSMMNAEQSSRPNQGPDASNDQSHRLILMIKLRILSIMAEISL